MPRFRSLPVLAVAVPLLCQSVTARADGWLIAGEAPAAVPMSDAHADRFAIGGMPALGVYRSLASGLLLGVRLRAGLLGNGDAPSAPGVMDPGVGGLGSASLGLRLHPLGVSASGGGAWIEVDAGLGVTGDDARFAGEVGIGWGFGIGGQNFGPALRVLRVQDGSPSAIDPGSATLMLVGVELSWGNRPRPAPLAVVAAVRTVEPAPRPRPAVGPCGDEPCPPAESDGDVLVDLAPTCPTQVSPIDVDVDGCSAGGVIEMVDNRIVLEERVLFDVRRARVKRHARRMLAAIVALWQHRPGAVRLVVEGHTDIRGVRTYNQWLSQLRADRVRDALVGLGFPDDHLETVGVGPDRPRDPGTSEEAHQRNRRVEFVLITDEAAGIVAGGGR